MSRHWKPERRIVGEPWGRPHAYARKPRRSWTSGATAAAVLAGAACVGLAYGYFQSRAPSAAADASAIEWNAVQSVPTRTPDAEDAEWEGRSGELDGTGLPRASGARNDAVRAAFGYCTWGGGTNCVVDGDTFYVNGDKVRIAGIDAPETHDYRCPSELALGNQATEKLHAMLNSGALTMTSIDRDRDVYGRLLRNVAVNGEDVGAAMVSAGVAREYGRGRRPWC